LLTAPKTLFAVLAFLLLSSCTYSQEKPPLTHVEVLCPDLGHKILIHNVKSDDFWEALDNFNKIKAARGTSENYTILIFRNQRSMQIKDIKSEDMREKCFARDVLWDHVDKDYIISQ